MSDLFLEWDLGTIWNGHVTLKEFWVGLLKNRDLQVRSSALSNDYYDYGSVAMTTTTHTGTCDPVQAPNRLIPVPAHSSSEVSGRDRRNGGERGSVFHDPLTLLFPSHVGGGDSGSNVSDED